jgi:hypothetical protein
MTILINDSSQQAKNEPTPEQRRQRARDLMTHLERHGRYLGAPGFLDWQQSFQRPDLAIHSTEDN